MIYEVFIDPVVDADGHPCERAQITRWLWMHSTSPMTMSVLNVKELVPNSAIRSILEDCTPQDNKLPQACELSTNISSSTARGHFTSTPSIVATSSLPLVQNENSSIHRLEAAFVRAKRKGRRNISYRIMIPIREKMGSSIKIRKGCMNGKIKLNSIHIP